jgi:hypothetical protein
MDKYRCSGKSRGSVGGVGLVSKGKIHLERSFKFQAVSFQRAEGLTTKKPSNQEGWEAEGDLTEAKS